MTESYSDYEVKILLDLFNAKGLINQAISCSERAHHAVQRVRITAYGSPLRETVDPLAELTDKLTSLAEEIFGKLDEAFKEARA